MPRTPIAPPTDPAQATAIELDIPPVTKWPRAVGITAIILGVFFLLAAACNVLSVAMTASFATVLPSDAGDLMAAQTLPWWLTITSTAISIALSIMLIVAGTRLIQRVRPVRGLFLLWSGLHTLTSGGALALMLLIQWKQMAALEDSPLVGSVSFNFGSGAATAACIWLITGLAIPLSGVIWFTRSSVVDEIQTWAMRGDTRSRPS